MKLNFCHSAGIIADFKYDTQIADSVIMQLAPGQPVFY
jgi:hypothetical protein